MRELRPFIVSAPLTIAEADKLDTDTIYVFDYENSFKDENDKEDKLITYLESFGGMFDIFVSPSISYFEKEKLVLRYFHSGSFFNIYTLTQTLIHILLRSKNIVYEGNRSLFSDSECDNFLERNKIFIDESKKLYDSLFVIMLYYSAKPTKDMKDIKRFFNDERINDDELSPNLLSVMLDRMFYKYYSKHISENISYYSFLFDNRLYKSMSFIDILTNKNNELLPVMMDLNNPKFQEFVIEKKKGE